MQDTYTDEELAHLPQTETVFDQPALDINAHQWIQRGYIAEDQCCGHPPITLPNGTMLIKEEGGYKIVDELTRK
jgi:hypothetical protein